MKKLALLFFLFLSAFANAQDRQKLAQETCDCINKKDLANATKKLPIWSFINFFAL